MKRSRNGIDARIDQKKKPTELYAYGWEQSVFHDQINHEREVLHTLRQELPPQYLLDRSTEGNAKFMSYFVELGKQIAKLDELATRFQSENCLTLQAFGSALRDHVFESSMELYELEKDEEINLFDIYKRSKRLNDQVMMFTEICQMILDSSSKGAAFCTKELLSTLYDMIIDEQIYIPKNYGIVFKLFCKTIQPYLTFLDDWLFSGKINDRFDEFMIVKNDQAHLGTGEYWSTFYQLREGNVPSFFLSLQDEILLTGKSFNFMEYIEKDIQSVNDSEFLENFVLENSRPSLGEAFATSVDKCTHHTVPLVDSFSVYHQDTPKRKDAPVGSRLYTSPVHQRSKSFMSEVSSFVQPSFPKAMANLPKEIDGRDQYQIELEESFYKDGAILFNDSFQQSQSIDQLTSLLRKKKLSEILHIEPEMNMEKVAKSRIPMEKLLSMSLLHHVREQYLRVCSYTVKLFLNQCQLVHHFTAIRATFLMERGDIMTFLTNNLFEKGNSLPISELELNGFLLEALQFAENYPKVYRYSHSAGQSWSIDIFQSFPLKEMLTMKTNQQKQLRLEYKVDFPMNIVITNNSLHTYNRVFQYLLQVRHAMWSISCISLPKTFAFHKVYLCIFEVRLFMNTLIDYIMSNTIDILWNKMMDAIIASKDLDQLIRHHNEFLQRMEEICLLQKALFIMQPIQKIIQLCIQMKLKCDDFSSKQQQDAETLEEFRHQQKFFQGISIIHANFRQNIHLLLNILQKILKQKSHEQLEALLLKLNFNGFYGNDQQ